jgi:hypothetical protein
MRELTEFEQAMLRQLRAKDGTNAKGILKRTPSQFIHDYGWFYEPAPLPKTVEAGNADECYNNALVLTLNDSSLIYVEGFAVVRAEGFRIHHAWVTDGNGRAIDNTWEVPGVVYVGVPFRCGFVSLMGLKNKGVGSLLVDYANGFPLLGELSDQPEKWLDPRGEGITRIAGQR